MTKANDAYIHKINQLTNQLSPDNQAYVEDLIVYVRSRTLFKNEEQVNASLYEIVSDILVAQENGESASAFFGKTPKDAGNDLIATFDAESPWSLIGLFLLIFLLINAYMVVGDFLDPILKINLINAILNAGITSLLIMTVFRLISNSVYARKSWRYYIGIGVIWIGTIAALIWVNQTFAQRFTITVQQPYDLIFITSIGTILLLLFVLGKFGQESWIFGVYILVLTVLGILVRVTSLGELLREKSPVAMFGILFILIVVGIGMPTFQTFKNRKNNA
ncbi:hypothetical protein [Weissella confusa]|uniref:DUF1129 domain-containing protein n=1 Tax=Weissella confusa TaxID=1583 RepID=A0A4Z0RVA8_WEICO|nr:hypothetical protein [Weissella confusa]TGE72454.1 hypothetical protein C6P11_06240 [Weissella confusa]